MVQIENYCAVFKWISSLNSDLQRLTIDHMTKTQNNEKMRFLFFIDI